MGELTLYHCNISYASQKVRIYCYEKGLSYISKHIDLQNQEQLTSDYHKINPNRTVPAIKDKNNKIICNSTAIMLHLEKQYPRPPILLPEEIEQQVLAVCYQHEDLQDPAIKVLTFHHLFIPKVKKSPAETKRYLHFAKNHPNPAESAFRVKAIQEGFSDAEVSAAENQCYTCIAKHNRELNEHNFICGAEYTLADVVVTATVYRILQVGYQDWLTSLPNLSYWYKNTQKRPSFNKITIGL